MSQKYSFVLVPAALVVLLASAAAVFAQSESTPPPFPPPGKLIDIGGWRLHLNCMGEARASQPTVILESGIGDFSVEWALVQPGVARFARVCSYDRAGDGWSELGPHPRTMRQIVYELHTLLNKGDVKPPFILVGHSYGGVLVRLYASTYPTDVVGMVLVEAGDDNPRRILPDGTLGRSSDLVKGDPIPAVKVSGPLRLTDIPAEALRQMKAAAQQAAQKPNEPPRNKLPSEAQRMRAWALARVEHIAAAVNPFEHEELAGLRAARAKTQYPLGDMPLIVLTRGLSEEAGPDGKAFAEEHRKDHAASAAMSRNGKLVTATNSGHHVQIDEPDLVIKAILDVMNASMKSSDGQTRSDIDAQKPPERVSIPTEDGGIIYADLYGSGSRGVVLAHGGQFNKESWEKQARVLVNAGFRVLAFDFRGYGQSKGPGQANPGSPPFRFDVLAAVRYLRKTGARTVSVVGASMGGGAAADASIEAPGEIDRIVLLAGQGEGPPEKMKGRKLFIVAREDANSGGPRLPRIREQYEKVPEPKQLIILDGSAHAQFLFQTDQGERLMSEILRFLSEP